MKIAITLVHNKSDAENEAQISTILGLVDRIADTHVDPETQEEFYTYHYEIKDLGVDHEVRFYHVVPYGVTKPSNLDELDGHKVYYGPEYQAIDKTYFDWGLKRGVDQGAEVSLYLEDLSKLDFKKMLSKLQKVADKADKTEFVQDDGGKIANLEYFRKGGLKYG